MADGLGKRAHRLVDKMVIHVETDELGHEIAYDRLREILDGYENLLGTLEDERAYNPDDTRTQQQESAEMKLSHRLYLSPATEGSYAVEARLYDDSDNIQLHLPLKEQGFSRVFTVIDCVANGDSEQFAQVVPSKLARQHVLDGIKKSVHALPSESGLSQASTRQKRLSSYKRISFNSTYLDLLMKSITMPRSSDASQASTSKTSG